MLATSETFLEFGARCFSGPNFAATILLIVVTSYWLFTLLSGLGMDFGFDLDLDAGDISDGWAGLGLVPLRWLNLGDVPLMLWLFVFSASLWFITLRFDLWMPTDHADATRNFLVLLRNGAIATVITKLLTQPFKGMTAVKEPNPVKDIIDKEGIANTEITVRHGQLRYELDGAPLLLNVRTESGTLAKGERAKVIDFDPDTRVYLVVKAEQEVPQ